MEPTSNQTPIYIGEFTNDLCHIKGKNNVVTCALSWIQIDALQVCQHKLSTWTWNNNMRKILTMPTAITSLKLQHCNIEGSTSVTCRVGIQDHVLTSLSQVMFEELAALYFTSRHLTNTKITQQGCLHLGLLLQKMSAIKNPSAHHQTPLQFCIPR